MSDTEITGRISNARFLPVSYKTLVVNQKKAILWLGFRQHPRRKYPTHTFLIYDPSLENNEAVTRQISGKRELLLKFLREQNVREIDIRKCIWDLVGMDGHPDDRYGPNFKKGKTNSTKNSKDTGRSRNNASRGNKKTTKKKKHT